jgi:hypothetical protein
MLASFLQDSQWQEAIQWLESVNSPSLHNAAFKKHGERTSAWLLQTT